MTTLTAAEAHDLFRAPPTRMLDLGDREVAVRTVGDGPDVLFVHGWPVSGATFRRLLPHLADRVTCHVIDLPGAGASRTLPGSPPSMAQHIDTVRRVVDELGLDDVAVVGHDSGGLIARHALARDARVRSMGLVNTEPPDVGWRFRSFLAVRFVPGLAPMLGRVAGAPRLRRSRAVFGDAFVDRSLLDGEFDEFFFAPLRRSADRRRDAVAVLRSFDMAAVRDLPAVHRAITVPVQLVWGERDPFFPVAAARAMVSTFADARLAVVPDAALFAHEERPAAVADALRDVLVGGRSSLT